MMGKSCNGYMMRLCGFDTPEIIRLEIIIRDPTMLLSAAVNRALSSI